MGDEEKISRSWEKSLEDRIGILQRDILICECVELHMGILHVHFHANKEWRDKFIIWKGELCTELQETFLTQCYTQCKLVPAREWLPVRMFCDVIIVRSG